MGLDLNAPFGEDLVLGPQPDVGTIGSIGNDFNFLTDRDELIQRIIHRLLTPKGEWIPFPDYGAGLRQYVGEPLSAQVVYQIQSEALAQLLKEPDISSNPPPSVVISQIPNGILAQVQVWSQPLGLISFSFNVGAFA